MAVCVCVCISSWCGDFQGEVSSQPLQIYVTIQRKRVRRKREIHLNTIETIKGRKTNANFRSGLLVVEGRERWRVRSSLPLLKRHFETLLSHQTLAITKEIDLPYCSEMPLADFAFLQGFG